MHGSSIREGSTAFLRAHTHTLLLPLLPPLPLPLPLPIAGDKNPETYDISNLPEGTLRMIEADSFWCLQKLLEGIQVRD